MVKKKTSAPKKKKNRLSAAAALQKLKTGNERYLAHEPLGYPTEKERGDYSYGQKPYAAILSCADSRVSPEIMFNAGLDELFVIRVAGNIADTTSIASIEYAVTQLNTNLIVVVGHEACGAVGAALANAEDTLDLGHNLNNLLGHITPAVAATKNVGKKQRPAATIKKNAKLNAEELRRQSPLITKTRGVEIVWAYYHLIDGKVDFSEFL